MARKSTVLLDGKPIAEVLPKFYRTMSLSEIVLKYGGSRSTLYAWVSKLGLKHDAETVARLKKKQGAKPGRKNYTRKHKTYCGMDVWEIVKRYYPTMSSNEIKEKFGCPASYVRTIARELGVKHIVPMRKRSHFVSCPKMSDKKMELARYRLKQTYKMERYRLQNGLPRKNKWRINMAPIHIRKIMDYLCVKRGYFRDCGIDSLTLFYDDETRRDPPRCRRNEAYYTEHYGIKFAPGSGYNLNKGHETDNS